MKEDKIVIYQTEDGQTQIDVRLENETVWLNVAQMASLFMKEESNVRRHVLNAFKEGELERDDNNVHFLHVNGVKKPVPFYSLDVIISVGYRRYAMEAINGLREKFGGSALFGNEKDDSFKSSIGQIYQTFGGEEL